MLRKSSWDHKLKRKHKIHIAAQTGLSWDLKQEGLGQGKHMENIFFFFNKLYNSSSQFKKIPNTSCVTDLERCAATGKSRDKQWEQSEVSEFICEIRLTYLRLSTLKNIVFTWNIESF